MRALSLGLAAATLLAGCLSAAAPVPAPAGMKRVAILLVAAPLGTEAPAPPPATVRGEVEAALRARGLAPVSVDEPALFEVARARALTADRLVALRAAAKDTSDVVVLVELTPRYFSQLSGQVRWSVALRATAASTADAGRRATVGDETSVFLRYPHEGASEALAGAAQTAARATHRALDELFGGAP